MVTPPPVFAISAEEIIVTEFEFARLLVAADEVNVVIREDPSELELVALPVGI